MDQNSPPTSGGRFDWPYGAKPSVSKHFCLKNEARILAMSRKLDFLTLFWTWHLSVMLTLMFLIFFFVIIAKLGKESRYKMMCPILQRKARPDEKLYPVFHQNLYPPAFFFHTSKNIFPGITKLFLYQKHSFLLQWINSLCNSPLYFCKFYLLIQYL